MIKNWQAGIDYPEWMTEESLKTLSRQHLLENETPVEMYHRVASALGKKLFEMIENRLKTCEDPVISEQLKSIHVHDIEAKWFSYMWKGWLAPSTPILSNAGAKRGFTISCFIERVPDSMDGIYSKIHEMAMLTKMGGGVGITFDKVRGRGEAISAGGFSEGVIPFMKAYDSAIIAASQGNVRRGSAAMNLPVRHKDIEEFLKMRIPVGDVNRQCLNLNHCVTIDDYFMESVERGDSADRNLYAQILSTRMRTGQPYIFYYHNVHRQRPADMVKRNLKIDGTNICCLTGDTKVFTVDGIFPIKDLVGKKVKIYDGEVIVECDNFKSYGPDTVYEIKLANGQVLKANADHRWFVAKGYNQVKNGKYTEVRTHKLQKNDFLEFKNLEYHGTKKVSGAYLKGFLIGDGTCTNEVRPVLNLHFPKFSCEQRLLKSGEELLKKASLKHNTIEDLSFSETVTLNNSTSFGKQIFKKMKGLTLRSEELLPFVTLYKKSLPEDIADWDKASKLEFLAGLFDADASYTRSGFQFTTIKRTLVEDLQNLLFTLGINSSLDEMTMTTGRVMFRLTIGSLDSYELYNILGSARFEQLSKKPNRRSTGFRKVVSVTKLEEKEEVFCPQVPTTKKFLLANGIMTGNTEIMQPHDFDHTVVCDLASWNLVKWDQYKDDPEFTELSLLFLDANMQLFIDDASEKVGFENAVRHAKKARALGLGILGFHTMLQQKNIPFISIAARSYIRQIGSKMKSEGEEYNRKWGKLLGNPEWCDSNRNLLLFAIAPTATNSIVVGGVSPSLEPLIANAWIHKTAKGTFIRRNKVFEDLIKNKYPEHDTENFWNELTTAHKGSVQTLEFLTEDEKEVFLTAYEINQLELVKNAGIWQQFIDQGMSLNLFFPADVDPKWFSNVHMTAWKEGIKSLYYVRTESILSRNMNQNTFSDCVMCEG
jgi:ribonucleoside-diphosphate reductase alpha chain